LEISGGVYHVTSRGDGGEDIYLSDVDRLTWLKVFADVCERFSWICYAWCQMTNHYHVLIETQEANLSNGMRQLNGVYTQKFNHAHAREGHVFQGRFNAILIEKESYLLEVARYVVLNPIRAQMVSRPEDWVWSSYMATCGQKVSPVWLQTDCLLGEFGQNRSHSIVKYVSFVQEGIHVSSVWQNLQSQIYLGTEEFVRNAQSQIVNNSLLTEIPHRQREMMVQTIAQFADQYPRKEAMARAYLSKQHKMAEIARYFDVHYSTVSRAVRNFESGAECVNARPDPIAGCDE
jgi:REP element-mobilizing transposase RayT